jgi:tetratricopeptide (TPR) repeat protein
MLRAQGDLAGAGKAYAEMLAIDRRLAAADPTNAVAQSDMSVDLQRTGVVLRTRGDLAGAGNAYAEALAISRRLAAADPTNAVAQRDFADASKVYDQAIAEYTRSIAVTQDYAPAYNGRAWAYHQEGEDANGLPDAERAVKLSPNNADSIETRAEIYERLGRRGEAVVDYRAALKLAPNMKRARDGLQRLGATP